MNEKNIRKILIALEESVDKEDASKKKLKEAYQTYPLTVYKTGAKFKDIKGNVYEVTNNNLRPAKFGSFLGSVYFNVTTNAGETKQIVIDADGLKSVQFEQLGLSEAKKKTESKKKLNEGDVLHTLMHTWEELHGMSKEWEQTPGEILRMCGALLFGNSIYKLNLSKIWGQLLAKGKDKVIKLYQASKIIAQSKSSQDAIAKLKQALGLDVQPVLQLAEAVRKEKKKAIEIKKPVAKKDATKK